MAWSQKEQRIATCVPAAATTFSQADNAHGSNVAVVLSAAPNINQDYPFPTVAKTSAITDVVYGKVVNYEDNGETNTSGAAGNRRVGIVTGGVVSFTASAAAAVGDVGKGISGSTTAGAVTVATGGGGRGAIVAIGDAGLTLWVDLDVPPLA